MSESFSPEVRARLDGYLDSVEAQLQTAGLSRQERRGIIGDVETQIFEMLPANPAHAVTLPEMDVLISRLDPPQAYGQTTAAPAASTRDVRTENETPLAIQRRSCRELVLAWRWIGLAALVQLSLFTGIVIAKTVWSDPVWNARKSPAAILVDTLIAAAATAAVISLAAPIVGTRYGWKAVQRIRRSGGILSGLPWAVVAALLYPIVAIWLLVAMFSYVIHIELVERSLDAWWTNVEATILLWGLVANSGLIWLLMRSARPRETDSKSENGLRQFRLPQQPAAFQS